MKKILFIFLVLSNCCFAQRDDSWQDDYTNVTNWWQYITPTAQHMGPFALPVPSVYEGRVEENGELSSGYSYYQHQDGDAPTHAMFSRFYFPIAKRVAVEITFIPKESYSYSDEMADYFHAQSTSGSGSGDVYINTYIQILKENVQKPDIAIRYGMKTASGSDLENARYTDSPGYYFDLSVGKTTWEKAEHSLRVFGYGGFYCWQYIDGNHMQDDAVMLGIGTTYRYKEWKLKGDISGYYGWKEDDKPTVLRIEGDIPLCENFKLRLMYERGINDFPYNGFHGRLVYQFSVPKW